MTTDDKKRGLLYAIIDLVASYPKAGSADEIAIDIKRLISEAGLTIVTKEEAASLEGVEQSCNDAYADGRADERRACAELVREKAATLHREGRMINEAARLDSLAHTIESRTDAD